MRVFEYTVDGWDLARCLGAKERLDPDGGQWCWSAFSTAGPELACQEWFLPCTSRC